MNKKEKSILKTLTWIMVAKIAIYVGIRVYQHRDEYKEAWKNA